MWPRTLLKGTATLPPKQIGWSRYVLLRRYATENLGEELQKPSESEAKVTELLNDAANFNEIGDPSWQTSPYPQTAAIPGKEEKIRQDPTQTSILMFPGQGTIKVGYVDEYLRFPKVKEIFQIANEILCYDVLKILQKGPKEKLNRTEFNQTATLALSLAVIERLWEERPRAVDNCKSVAGYSVGELAALVFSGCISMEDGLRLAAVRGAAMQAASDKEPQGMLSVYCKPASNIAEACEEAKRYAMDVGVSEPVCSIAIYLHPQTKILAGHEQALEYIEKNHIKLGFRHLRRLPLSGAFHTRLMQPAVKSFKKALDKVDIERPRVKTFSNVTGKPYHDAEDIRKQLPKQLYRPVKWEQIMHEIFSRNQGTDFPRAFDMGSAGIMKAILGKVNAKAADSCFSI
ncbi:probable malonyl-CoA-acyl carrier protein transacylase, mitochondrial [Diachasma alloeum]|uniref:probable malonyl-CoA-acyl carrier protein transacylase, mitochondrial n=1 Tax=Diachasma alloeum TaxID=454923 RepID=UPI00073851AA|nr:probable malonyl-CoA-acyl carrier protein transacylase, mitochondrial [Diachasma alloeum]